MRKNTIAIILIIIPWIAWIGGFLRLVYMSAEFEGVNSDVNASNTPLPMNLEIVEDLSDDVIILYDDMRDFVFIYDYEGELINKFRFYDTGSMWVIDYSNDILTMYSIGDREYYKVNNEGVVIEVYEGEMPDERTETSWCIEKDIEVCSKNYFFYHKLVIDGEKTFISYSFFPIVIVLASCIVVSARLSVTNYRHEDDY